MIAMTLAKCVVFDLDGTLTDSVPDIAAAINRLMRARDLAAFSEAEIALMVGDGARVLLERAFAARGLVMDQPSLTSFLADYTENSSVLTRPYPGVTETLAALLARGWILAVCTNKPEYPARVMLEALGLAPFFVAICGGDTFAVRKPDPGHLLGTLRAAGGDPARSVMVGDHHNDLDTTKGTGVRSVWARWGYGVDVRGSDAEANAFTELPAIIDGFGIA